MMMKRWRQGRNLSGVTSDLSADLFLIDLSPLRENPSSPLQAGQDESRQVRDDESYSEETSSYEAEMDKTITSATSPLLIV